MYELRVGRRRPNQWTRLTWLDGARHDLAWPYGPTQIAHQGKPAILTADRWVQLPAGIWVWLDFTWGTGVLTSITEEEYLAVKRGP